MDKPEEEKKEVKKEPAIDLPDVEQIIGPGKHKEKEKLKEKLPEKPNIQGVPKADVSDKKPERTDKEIPRLSKIPGSYTKPPEIAEQPPAPPIPEVEEQISSGAQKETPLLESPEKKTPRKPKFKFKNPSVSLKPAQPQQEIITKPEEQEEEKPGSLYGMVVAISLIAMALCSYLIVIQYFGLEAPRFVRTILDLIYKVTS